MRIVFVIVAIISSVLGYGYWHAYTHAAYHVDLRFRDGSDAEAKALPGAEVKFIDGEGHLLAEGSNDQQHGYVHLIHPDVGSCHEVEKQAPFDQHARAAWHDCFEHQSIWVSGWVKDVSQVQVHFENCVFRNIPVTVSGPSSDWYLWWVPHPHIGGKPYSYYSSYIRIDENECINNGAKGGCGDCCCRV